MQALAGTPGPPSGPAAREPPALAGASPPHGPGHPIINLDMLTSIWFGQPLVHRSGTVPRFAHGQPFCGILVSGRLVLIAGEEVRHFRGQDSATWAVVFWSANDEVRSCGRSPLFVKNAG